MDCDLDDVESVIMDSFSDELFPDFFGEIMSEPIDFSTTHFLPKQPDDHTYVAGSPSSDDSGLSSDASPNTPPMSDFFRDSIGGLDIKQEPRSPVSDLDTDFLNEFKEEKWCVKEEVNLDELPALSALNNPSSILEDEIATEFLITQELSPQQHVQKSVSGLGTISMSQIQQVPRAQMECLQDFELLTAANKANRVNVVRVNKPNTITLNKEVLNVNGNILTATKYPMRPASVAGASSWHSSTRYPKLNLTEEEKVLLDKEGVALPPDGPLTKEEDRLLKAVRRKIRNKISAKESRKKKQMYVDGLEDRVKACTVHNIQLQKKVKKLEEQNDSLMQQLKKLQNYVANGASRTTQVSTCAMVLLFSFALVVLPSLNKLVKMEDSSLARYAQEESNNQKAPIMPGRSRSLLQDMDTDTYTIPYGPQDPLPKSPAPEVALSRSRAKFFDDHDDQDPYGVRQSKMVIQASPKLADPVNIKQFLRENDTSQSLLKPIEDRSAMDFDVDLRIGTADLKNEPYSNTA